MKLLVVVAIVLSALGVGKHHKPPPVGEVNVLAYGTSDGQIRQAISAAKAGSKQLYFPTATYNTSATLDLTGLQVRGDGPSSRIVAAQPSQMALVVRGVGPSLRNVQITSNASTRLSTPQSAGVFVDGASGFTIASVTVDRSGSAGIFLYGASSGSVSGNTMRNTLADAIHITHGSGNIDVGSNWVENAGDDMIGIVGYEADGSRPHDIFVHDNNLTGQVWGRGVSAIGAINVRVLRNKITHSRGAAILVASEPGWLTYGSDNIELSDNVIRDPDWANIHGANILVSGLRAGYPVTNVYGTGNDCDDPKPIVRSEGSYAGITVSGFYGA